MAFGPKNIVPLAAAFLFLSLGASQLFAGPEPKQSISVPREIYVTDVLDYYDPDSRENACAEGFRYATWYELKRCNYNDCVYRNDLGYASSIPKTPNSYPAALEETCLDWAYSPIGGYKRENVSFDYDESEFQKVTDEIYIPGFTHPCDGTSGPYWCIDDR